MDEATARIKINSLLEAAGWRFFADGDHSANIRLEEWQRGGAKGWYMIGCWHNSRTGNPLKSIRPQRSTYLSSLPEQKTVVVGNRKLWLSEIGFPSKVNLIIQSVFGGSDHAIALSFY